ncbi:MULTISPECIES: AraC family transcriptional regulator [unclassified Oceanispirochaeta]|uniref:helix-turn-helix domain-containing protein n=1 Tax=unclassified Oceanispirochaeta TaxID=2635722 RepID=UPI000E0942CA|nr:MULTISPECIES: AraC family transcriptional regulator [unclassified Oceanispirochaeta]MBF9017439.1 helix-turn-helix transcriptional regulator [Oceanispirochaeta sp. M2]NPD74011.1 helix-turn-helix transcriptional regulator [Oceanispirochaeta sp. M1]RDG30182.1 AraC family transcriptional regulator [Oceanispirochaeta sp. M1]
MKKHKIIHRFLISYLLFLLIPIVSSVLIYMSTAKMVESDIILSNKQFLEDSIEILDKELANIDYTINRLIMNNDVNSFLNTETPSSGSSDFFKVMLASYEIHSYTINTDFIKELLVYSRANDFIITTERVHTEIKNDYDYFFKFGDLTYEQWNKEILNSYHHYSFLPAINVFFAGNVHEVIPFIQSVPFFSRKHFKGNIMGFIDVEKLGVLLMRLNREEMGCVYLFNSSDSLLATFGDTELNLDPLELLSSERTSIENLKIENRKWLISQTTSKIAGFRILSILPSTYIDQKISYIEKIILTITVFLLILGTLSALYLSYRNSKPVLELSDIARKQLDNINCGGNDLDIIKTGMTNLIQSNKELFDYKKMQIPLSRNSFLEKLLNCKNSFSGNMDAMLKYNEIELGNPPYNVILIFIEGYGPHLNDEILAEKDLVRIVIINTWKNIFSEKGYFLQIDTEHIVWIYGESETQQLKKNMTQLHSRLKLDNSINILLSRGRSQKKINDICKSYQEASQGMAYMLTIGKDKPICNFDERPQRSDVFLYNIDLESRLILYIKTGQVNEMNEVLDVIYRENFEKRNLSVFMMNQLLKTLQNTLIRVNEKYQDNNKSTIDTHTISSPTSAIEKFNIIRELFTRLVHKVTELNNTELQNLKETILKYIDKNYSDQNLNLDAVADQLGYKESYLYHFFYDSFEQSFASYLESLRLTKACELLKTRSNTIDSIAENTGYGSAHSFRRAFKRRFDVSPTIYKKSLLIPSGKTDFQVTNVLDIF